MARAGMATGEGWGGRGGGGSEAKQVRGRRGMGWKPGRGGAAAEAKRVRRGQRGMGWGVGENFGQEGGGANALQVHIYIGHNLGRMLRRCA